MCISRENLGQNRPSFLVAFLRKRRRFSDGHWVPIEIELTAKKKKTCSNHNIQLNIIELENVAIKLV